MHKSLAVVAAVLSLSMLSAPVQAEVGYYRSPSVHHDTLVFTAEGDLWSVAASGGRARRLTTHAAEETEARISPDGRWIAFSASYDSAVEAYVMPIEGGPPRRLSFDGARVWIQGWTSENEVLYASENLSGPSRRRVLRAIDPLSLRERTLPLYDVNEAAISEDGKTLYFTRFGLQLTGDNARGYRGGAMSQLWKFELASKGEAVRIGSELKAALSRPMWWNDRLYFVSDADGVHNLWSMHGDGSDPQQHSRHAQFDVRSASLGSGQIVYQNGADLRRFDIASGDDRVINIDLVSDFEQRRQRWLRDASKYLTDIRVADNGSQAILTARGKIVLAATGTRRRVEIAVPDQHRARAAVLSKDGKQVYAISDIDGRNEIWRFAADGSNDSKQLTRDGNAHRWRLYPSPDGKWLAHDDKRGQLWLLNLANGDNRMVDQGPKVGDDAYLSVAWSADSHYLAIARAQGERQIIQLHVYDLAERKLRSLGSDRYNAYAPAFSPDGQWLYFLSERNFVASPGAPWGDRNLGPGFDRRTKVYAYGLQAEARFPFLAADELHPEQKSDAADVKAADDDTETRPNKKPAAAKLPALQWADIESRVYEVPIAAGNYRRLDVDAQRLYLLDSAAGDEAKPLILTLEINAKAPSPETFLADVADFQLSADRSKLLIVKHKDDGPGDIFIVDPAAKAAEELSKEQVRLNDWALAIDPRQEWQQMFVDAWRMHRDFSFDPGMRGVDWNAVRSHYEPLLARVSDRAELDDLLGQMSAELGILHSQVRGGEFRKDAENAVAASLGAEFERIDKGVRISHIYRTEVELPGERGPLQKPGVDVREGDLIVAVNGRAVREAAHVAELLQNQAGQQVLLDIERAGKPRQQLVQPVAADGDAMLRYNDWVQQTRSKVDAASDTRIGYLHLRAMGPKDIASFTRDFYASHDRDGLIIDVRRNRGGNIDSWLIEKLLRRTWAFWQDEHSTPYWNMQQGFRGHLVVLIDPLTYSDGETFAAGIKALDLAPLIGQRTAGAGIWLSDRNRLSDNGSARVAENGQFGADGRWLIEGHGVGPDIEVENLPFESYNGRDRQLEAALDYLQRKLKAEPISRPKAQAIPPRGTPAGDVDRR